MTQPGRARSKSKHGEGKHLASINFPLDMLEFLDKLGEELDMNRSSLVVCILKDFQNSGKTIQVQIVGPINKEKNNAR